MPHSADDRSRFVHLEQVGPYVVDALRRQTTTFTTYRAHHEATGERVRLAVLDPDVARNADELAAFRRYAQNLALLNHPHLISGVEADFVGGYHFVVMEHPDGHRLSQLIESEGAFRQRRALKIARQIAGATAHLHGLGVVHGRVKACNVLLTAKDTAKLGGLGGVDLAHAGADLARGGPDDTAPVLITEGRVNGASDLYGIGFTLLQMITGRLKPLAAARRAEVSRTRIRLPDPSGSHTLQTDALLWRSMADDPSARFRSIDGMIAALDAALRELEPKPARRVLAPTETSTAPLAMETDPFDTEPLGEI